MRKGLLWALAIVTAAAVPRCAGLPEIRQYIQRTWDTLTRSEATLLRSALDTKVGQKGRVILYIPRDESAASIRARLGKELPATALPRVDVRPLPDDPNPEPGLLYLPFPYVVPGGRFNEMYGWDSYFILLGLLQDGRTRLAKDMTDNMVYEVAHYGKVLNANRSYFLTRSQPPFLSRMVLEVYQRTGNLEWLRSTLGAIERYYAYWTSEPHLTSATGLSRYYGGADTPAPEVVQGERDASGLSHYDRVRAYYRTHTVNEYDAARFYDRERDRLTGLFYQADRAMRESGFDPSNRYGPFSAGILDYNPVDLNCLLYRMELDTAVIHTLLDQPREARLWAGRAEARARAINERMWNEETGLYFDYDFVRQRQSQYRFLTTFYPLWAGIASPEQAAKVAANLEVFERAGGLQTSDRETGNQWDAPYGWAPLEIIACQGLRHYGFTKAADRISAKFLAMVLRDFAEHGTIKEKYDVVTGRSDLAAGLRFGYTSNEAGFGWTNAAFLVLYSELSPAGKEQLREACAGGSAPSRSRLREKQQAVTEARPRGSASPGTCDTLTISGCRALPRPFRWPSPPLRAPCWGSDCTPSGTPGAPRT